MTTVNLLTAGKMLPEHKAFREWGAPTNYSPNPTPAIFDKTIVTILFLFLVPTMTYLILLPGIRRKRLHSTATFMFSMIVGVTLFLSLYHPCWYTAEAKIRTMYKSSSKDKMTASLIVQVGLEYLNITLETDPVFINGSLAKKSMYFNERFGLPCKHCMLKEFQEGLRRGLPYPILKIMEYMTNEGFGWGRGFRVTGYYTSAALICAIGFWIMSLVSLAFIPHYFCRTVLLTGVSTVIGDLIFFYNVPNGMDIILPSENGHTMLIFAVSRCFYATSIVGLICIHVGYFLLISEWKNNFFIDTIFTTQKMTSHSLLNNMAFPSSPRICHPKYSQQPPTLNLKFLPCIYENM